jgi:hypothetical protein
VQQGIADVGNFDWVQLNPFAHEIADCDSSRRVRLRVGRWLIPGRSGPEFAVHVIAPFADE